MNLTENFRKEDIREADTEIKCIEHLQLLIEMYLEKGSIEQAKLCADDVLNSMTRIGKLSQLKREEDNLHRLMSHPLPHFFLQGGLSK